MNCHNEPVGGARVAIEAEPDQLISTPLWRAIILFLPGLALASGIAGIAYGIEYALGIPQMISALALGLLTHLLLRGQVWAPGLAFGARTLLRVGVALLGAGITVQQIAGLGWGVAALTVCGVALTILCGVATAKALRLDRATGLIFGGAVAICGAAAALAISSALPDNERNRATTALAVVGVTVLSTLAMAGYPLIASALAMSDHQAGIFFGAAIHDVAQVVGAGYLVSDHAGETATIVKLMRVACLVPVVACVGWLAMREGSAAAQSERGAGFAASLFPWFLIGFLLLSLLASSNAVAAEHLAHVSTAAKAFLVTAIAALGCKTSLVSLCHIGLRPLVMLATPTLVLAIAVIAAIAMWPALL